METGLEDVMMGWEYVDVGDDEDVKGLVVNVVEEEVDGLVKVEDVMVTLVVGVEKEVAG